MPTVCFRGGCLTGPNHAGAQLHGFLSYLMRCTVTGEPYTVFGYGGKQVRDNIHSADLVRAFAAFHARAARRPRSTTSAAAASRNCSMLEAIALCEQIAGRELDWTLSDEAADRRPPLVDQRPVRRSSATTRTGRSTLRHRGRSCARSTTRNVERWAAARVKLSVVIPAHNEAGSIARDGREASPRRSSAEQIDYEIVVVDDASARRRPPTSSRASASATRASAASARTIRRRLRLRRARRARRLRRATPWRS